MSKESFAMVVAGVAVLFLIVVSLWFSPSSILRPKLPKRQVVQNSQIQTNEVLDVEDVVEVTVSATEYAFEPSVINATVGQKVVVTVRNDGAVIHDFVVRLANDKLATKLLEPGMSETIEFVVDTPGSFEFYCSVPGHREKGMEGTLIVK